MDTQNRVSNVTMAKAKKTALDHFPETVMWCLLVPIDTSVLEPQKKFAGGMEPTLPDESCVQVIVNHNFSKTIERMKSYGECFGKGD